MGVDREGFREELCRATRLVRALVAGRISMIEFNEKYDNCYCRLGLEPGDVVDDELEILVIEFEAAIDLHHRIQLEVMGRLYFTTDRIADAAFRAAGRLSAEDAAAAIRTIVSDSDIESIQRAVC